VAVFASSLRERIKSISTALRNGSFHFQPARGTTIPKSGGRGKRPLRVFNIKDRLVQKAILLRIEQYFPEINNPVSFAYLKEQSISKAVGAIKRGKTKGYRYVLLADVESFFENVDRKRLLEEIVSRLPDKSINGLLEEAVNADIGNRDALPSEEASLFPTTSRGVAQGSILAPFFSNVYMIPIDSFLMEKGMYGVRYADDLAVMTNTRTESESSHSELSQLLSRTRGLNLYPLKGKKRSRILPISGGFDFLGVRFEIKNGTWSLTPAPAKVTEICSEIKRWTDSGERWPLLDRMVILSRKFQGWMRSYKSVCRTKEFAVTLDTLFMERIHSLLKARGFIADGLPLSRKQMKFLSIQSSVRSQVRPVLLPRPETHLVE